MSSRINIIYGDPVEPPYRDKVVLRAFHSHGDADDDTVSALVCSRLDQSRLQVMYALVEAYQNPQGMYGPNGEITIRGLGIIGSKDKYGESYQGLTSYSSDSLLAMFPWDNQQSQHGEFYDRATLEKYELVYYSQEGVPRRIVLEKESVL